MVQLVHYPMFHGLSKKNFSNHIQFHKKRISVIVVPVMIAELLTSAALAGWSAEFKLIHIAGLALVTAIWLVTFFLQVPIHNKLPDGFDQILVQKLVLSNWYRTVFWTLKSILGIYLLYQTIQ
jgi:hypothetical protein